MKPRSLVCVILVVIAVVIAPDRGLAQTSVVRPLARDLIEALSSSSARQAGRTAAQELEKVGGEHAVKALSTRLVQEGGEPAVEAAATLVRRHGADALEALMRAPSVLKLQRALGELPEDMVGKAVRALTRGEDGRALAQSVERMGAQALRLEVQHPGVGGVIARELGAEGIEVASRLTTTQAIVLSRYAIEIAALPATQKQQFLKLLQRRAAEVFAFFERHPKVLFTSATVTVILAEADRVLGGSEVSSDEAGRPHVITRPGFVERLLTSLFGTPILLLSIAAAMGIAGWCGVRLYFCFRRREREFIKPKSSQSGGGASS